MSKATITANVTKKEKDTASLLAFIQKRSLRALGGEAIRNYLEQHRRQLRAGARLPKP